MLKKEKKTGKIKFAIHIVSTHKYRDSIELGGRCIVPSLADGGGGGEHGWIIATEDPSCSIKPCQTLTYGGVIELIVV